ncbi:hypothetical protein PISL3812_04197 [Talaromyces islandicus]|uniref:5'-3' DNA helicase ZGRF1-like N-terminal domain-containing protein n=1 Tax=Talaromyces islandicus TaxID=28573 RepID=A0A0U1LX68_TALIS|nr:hypothetical protein PISL3812_04197 [Talaromyces islandicus]
MSRPPSSARGPPSAGVPASQNTAPVIKFRCLFTHDVRRKAKRWQDGYLKFHTFNKRAMVYDDTGNFIGDHHWRDSNDIQDGDELELDKGVLIQVSECMETTQSDLSALFEKRKASQESPRQEKSSAPPPSSRTPLPSRTGALKSLNDLLGIKRPSIGRAVLPSSPYEQRHSSPARPETNQQDGPRAKRQRQQPSAGPSQRESVRKEIQRSSEIIELEDPAPRAKRVRPVPNKPLMTSGPKDVNRQQKKTSGSKDAIPEPASNRQAIDQENQSHTPGSAVRLVASSHDEPRPEPVEPPSHASVSTSSIQVPRERKEPDLHRPNTPINPLRMSIQEPRQKLMYRVRPLKAASSSTAEPVQAGSNQAVDGQPFTQPNPDFDISASTLAVLEVMNDNGTSRDAGATNFLTGNNVLPKESTSQSFRRTALYRIPSHSAIHGSAASPGGIYLSDDDSPSTPQVNAEHHNDESSHAEKQTLMRSHSDLSSMLPNSNSAVSAPDALVPELVGEANPALAPASRRNQPKPFRKSYSDTTALRNADQHRHGPSSPVATRRPARTEPIHESDKGPWTAEAWDFFDWWPPGRPMPL